MGPFRLKDCSTEVQYIETQLKPLINFAAGGANRARGGHVHAVVPVRGPTRARLALQGAFRGDTERKTER